MAIRYSSEQVYLDEAQDLKDKIARIEKIIDGLLKAAESAAANQDISSYSLDDGQTSISASYRSAEDALAAVQQWEKLKDFYKNRLNGTDVFQLKPASNFRRPW